METTTQDYLRKAAIEALTAKADTAALELLAMLHGHPTQTTTPRAVQRVAQQLASIPPPHGSSALDRSERAMLWQASQRLEKTLEPPVRAAGACLGVGWRGAGSR